MTDLWTVSRYPIKPTERGQFNVRILFSITQEVPYFDGCLVFWQFDFVVRLI